MAEPVLLSILFADRVITENNNKKGIIGTFDRFMSPSFPVIFPPWGIYVAITNLIGKHQFVLSLTVIDTDQVVLPIEGEFESANIDGVVELTLNLNGVSFPEPGRYNLSVLVDGELIGSRVLKVDLLEQTGAM
ncbi:DUF6941 family protein [Leptospira sp. 'Mane']|uniref:DUF6941 family protein n=1 Tax=Leptospira sp. 'Mane' TaxID=3387407 RepID=UPI00398AAA99